MNRSIHIRSRYDVFIRAGTLVAALVLGLTLSSCDIFSGTGPPTPPGQEPPARAAALIDAEALAEFKTADFSDYQGTYYSVSAGSGFTCALTIHGKLYCWGSNARGQLGSGNDTLALSPRPVPVQVPSGVQLFRPKSGYQHVCALAWSGSVYCWGDNTRGEVGDGTTANYRFAPVEVQAPAGVRFQHVVTGHSHTCGLTEGGQIYCWGDNSDNQLGNATDAPLSAVPVQLTLPEGVQFVTISANVGAYHTCGTTRGGAVYCWGEDLHGQLGDGMATIEGSDDPTKVVDSGTGERYFMVSPGFLHTVALTKNGDAFAWGSNGYGQLGDGTRSSKAYPVAVAGSDAYFRISAGGTHSCAIRLDGRIYCWGSDGWGKIGNGGGDGGKFRTPEPVAIDSVSFRGLDAGFNHSCAVTLVGRAFCWGKNLSGELGIGVVGDERFALVEVLPPGSSAVLEAQLASQ